MGPRVAKLARRSNTGAKGSRRTRKRVTDSAERLDVKFEMAPGVVFTFNLTAPPQPDEQRIANLAKMQVGAFFYWITFTSENSKGYFWPGEFYIVTTAPRADWGSARMQAFMDAVIGWEPRVLAIGADSFFKIVIRKHPTEKCWSWGLEWNHGYRLVGFAGDRKVSQEIWENFPTHPKEDMPHGSDIPPRLDDPLRLLQ